MKLFQLFRKSGMAGPEVRGTCLNCRHFSNCPAQLEAAIPGMLVMSSGHASVRADDGLCAIHERYLGAHLSCARFESR